MVKRMGTFGATDGKIVWRVYAKVNEAKGRSDSKWWPNGQTARKIKIEELFATLPEVIA
ncbi:MAG TPA: hypothetical protein VN937_08875 [Blastocatellia bacterium]|nr:hypothetical protein [Blastocatellia bacterium]